MAERSFGLPSNIDVMRPNVARIYDYMLGGASNFAVDRRLADKLFTGPSVTGVAWRLNRSFLRRAVRFCATQGIRQYLDLGSGIPTVGNVHQIAQEWDPNCRVVYVDREPVAVAHSRTMLRGSDGVAMVHADVRDPDTVLGAPETRRLLDFGQPIGLLAVSLFQFIAGADEPDKVLAQYRDAIPPGSFLIFSHLTGDHQPAGFANVVDEFAEAIDPVQPRSWAGISALLADFDLVEPGLVFTPDWRPEPAGAVERPERSACYGAVGRRS